MRLVVVEPTGRPRFRFVGAVGVAVGLAIGGAVSVAIGGAVLTGTDVAVGFSELSLW